MQSEKMTLESIKTGFRNQFGYEADVIVQSPGRINLIGEHTDYNLGFVLPASVDRYMYLALGLNHVGAHRLHAMDLNEDVSIKITDLSKTDHGWVNFFIGIFRQLTHDIGSSGIDCVFSSEIPIGGGMSSSSALECGILKGLNELLDLKLSNWELINISQKSNHEFLAINGGILDQFACLFGKKDHAMLLDCRGRSFNYLPCKLPDHQWVLINSMITHDHSTSAYNDRVAACMRAVEIASQHDESISSLRDVTFEVLNKIKLKISKEEYQCCKYILEENKRVMQFGDALKNNNIDRIGSLLYKSHDGLKNQYKVSCPELDLLVDLTMQKDAIAGSRMMGGGFGGCTLNLIESKHVLSSISGIQKAYHKITGIDAEVLTVNLCDGASIIV